MCPQLFNPVKFKTSDNIILIANFPHSAYIKKIEHEADVKRRILGSRLFSFPKFDILYGFIGYPNLLTLIEFISDIKKKNIFFLGTAGCLNIEYERSAILNVKEISAGGIFEYFGKGSTFSMNGLNDRRVPDVKGVSVDLIQREDTEWFSHITKTDVDIVEMEIYPLRWYIGNNFTAVVVTTDMVTKTGVFPFSRKETGENAVRAFEIILEKI
jgi:hypothetical protein